MGPASRPWCALWIVATLLWTAAGSAADSAVFEVPLQNGSFNDGLDARGVPRGWSRYGTAGKQELQLVAGPDGEKALLLIDNDDHAEGGVTQSFPLQGGQTYRVSVAVKAVDEASPAGAYVQFRFLPSNQFVQKGLAGVPQHFREVSVTALAPPGTTRGVVYLYSHRDPTPRVIVAQVRVTGGHPPPPPPPPPAVPPQYTALKDLHLQIPLARAGAASAAIVIPRDGAYRAAAVGIQRAVAARCGVTLPIVADDAAEAAVPLHGNLVVLGNRSTNRTMAALYDRHYCLMDLKYPGPEGYAIRTLHNPFGNGWSVVLVGGSDPAGVAAGATALGGVLAQAPAQPGELSIGWTMQTQLGRGLHPPTDLREFETWDASKGYGSTGYFGWCSISKRMAMYYMTGDQQHAREVVRLAFPDRQALKEIEEIDGERIENKHDPLAGFYHYNAHLAILYWDLIEESPAFSDEERLRITNAFARQLNHRKDEGVYGLTQPPAHVGSRHGQWSALSLYCLGRYFHKDYPEPVWAQCVRGGELAFGSLHEHAWITGENDNLFWYNTAVAPVLVYMVLTGDRKPLENGVLATLLRGQEILVSGRTPDWALHSAALSFLNQAAYLTGDGRWIEYRRRTGVDTDRFRLGQSFWPDEELPPQPPADLPGKWSIARLPQPAWEGRSSGIPWDQSFYFGSYRSAGDAGGDYLLLDGFNGASRNPYHTFDLLELRIAGHTLLQGYQNQTLTSADGMVEPAVAMDAALRHSDVLGPTAIAVGEVPKAAFCNWRRTLAQRTGCYALIVDDLTFRTDSRNMKATTTWQPLGGRYDKKTQAVRIGGVPAGEPFELRSCDPQEGAGSGVVTMTWRGAVRTGQHRKVFYAIAPATRPTACLRVADDAAVLALPQLALAVAGRHGQTAGELAIVAEDHLHGHALTQAGLEQALVSAAAPIDIDWDFAAGTAHVVAAQPTTLRLAVRAVDELRRDGQAAHARRAGDCSEITLPAGRHTVTGATPSAAALAELAAALRELRAVAQKRRDAEIRAASTPARSPLAEIRPAFTAQIGGKPADLITCPGDAGPLVCVAVGNTIQQYDAQGRAVRRLQTDGAIRVLRWWDEPKLLLAGCTDERVIAFDAAGRRAWVFTSEMDPAVYEAAKTYWFKTAPGHEGVHGLTTGAFDGGQNRCFVGSACTLEILDQRGQLVKRMPVFWGPVGKFLFVAGPAASRNLLLAQWPNGNDELAIVNSQTLAVAGRGYWAVPSGHSAVGGWTAQNRTAILDVDLDGDGRREVATAINGTWNRVTVYSEDGRPLANAQFGAGASNAPRAQMRALVAADLAGQGQKSLVVAVGEGLVVALDAQCRPVWSTRLASPPVTLRCVAPPGKAGAVLVVGCEDGGIVTLDGQGAMTARGQATGRPTHHEILDTSAGPLAVVATDRGELAAFPGGPPRSQER